MSAVSEAHPWGSTLLKASLGLHQYTNSNELIVGLFFGLAIETKVYLDHSRANSRAHLLAFYDQLPSARTSGPWTNQTLRNDKGKSKKRDFSALQSAYVSIGPPPPKEDASGILWSILFLLRTTVHLLRTYENRYETTIFKSFLLPIFLHPLL